MSLARADDIDRRSNTRKRGQDNFYRNDIVNIRDNFLQHTPTPEQDKNLLHCSPHDPDLEVELMNKDLWELFAACSNEMVVTKPGRRLFPHLRFSIKGMDPAACYFVIIDLVNSDKHKYRFQNKKWSTCGEAEPPLPPTFYVHPSSPSTGKQWMKEEVSYEGAKITKCSWNLQPNKFLVHSMHRYQPRLHVIRATSFHAIQPDLISTFSFVSTMFVTVTAYQNIEIINLKVRHNPFARGFRGRSSKSNEKDNEADDITKLLPLCNDNTTSSSTAKSSLQLQYPVDISQDFDITSNYLDEHGRLFVRNNWGAFDIENKSIKSLSSVEMATHQKARYSISEGSKHSFELQEQYSSPPICDVCLPFVAPKSKADTSRDNSCCSLYQTNGLQSFHHTTPYHGNINLNESTSVNERL